MDGYDAIVLAGGAARRLGGADKPGLQVDGAALLDRVVGAVPAAGRVVVVGPARPLAREVTFCLESPPGGGPVAALAAGLPRTTAGTVLLLGADLPWIAGAVEPLLAALPESGVALLVDGTGRANYLAAAWRRVDLVTALAGIGEPSGASLRELTARVARVLVPDPADWGQDCDTWEDLAAARRRPRPEEDQ